MKPFRLMVAGVRRELASNPNVVVTRTAAERSGRAIPPEVLAQMSEAEAIAEEILAKAKADGMPLEVRHSGAWWFCANRKCGALCVGNVDQKQRGLCGPCKYAASAPPLAGSQPLPPAA